jgi:hypothetical protein
MRKLLVLMLVFAFLTVGCTNGANTDIEEPEFNVISIDDIEDEDINQWYQENFQEHGYYVYEGDSESYLLISAGERPTGGYSLELKNEQLIDGKFSADVVLNEPTKDDMVIMILTYPSLLIKFENLTSLTVELDLEDLEQDIATPSEYRQILARFNGQIDNNSIEIDTSIGFHLQELTNEEDALAVRYNEEKSDELRTIIDTVNTGEWILFDGHKDEFERLILDEVLDIGHENQSHIISGIYTGRIDNNFIEVEIASYPIVFMIHVETEEEIHGEIEASSELVIQYKISENGQRIIEDFIVK